MKRKPALIKFIIVAAVTIIGIVASFVSFNYSFFGKTYKYEGIQAIKLGLDLQGGIYAVYEATESNPSDSRMNGTVTQLSGMLTSKGFSEATVVREGVNRIRVEVPDIDDPEDIFEVIGEPAELEFVLSSDGSVDGETIFTGDVVADAYATYEEGEPCVALRFNSEGASKFADVTANNINSYIKIYSIQGGTRQVISNAKINSAIPGGQAIISGNYTYESAETLANQIMSGTFSVTLGLLESSVVSPTLGENALLAGIIGGSIAFILIMAFMCYFYRMMGMVASFAMIIYMVLMFFFLATLPWVQLSLPGIAGIILSLGMMIDGNVIIYERIKEEYRNGKSLLAAYHSGFKKAATAIIDGNITTIIAAVMLMIFGTGTIAGFGLTLLVGLILSVFSSLVVTRFLLKWTIAIFGSSPKLYRLFRKAGFDEHDEIQYVPKKKNDKKSAKGMPTQNIIGGNANEKV